MTRTQLQEMSDRDLVEYTRREGHTLFTQETADLFAELANRLDDRYPFFVMTDEQKAAWEEAMTAPSEILQDIPWKEATGPLVYIRQTPTPETET